MASSQRRNPSSVIGAGGKAVAAEPWRNSRASEPVVAVLAEGGAALAVFAEGGAALASIAEEPDWTPTGVLGLRIRSSADVVATDPSNKKWMSTGLIYCII
jgi:hypothetical protein